MSSISFEQPLISCTPSAWASYVCSDLGLLLSDHALCERKAAAFALGLLQRYGAIYNDHASLSRLVREEMRHYELVIKIIKSKKFKFYKSSPNFYARNLRNILVNDEPIRHVQNLAIAAIIEARSCERFEVLSKYLSDIDSKLALFYSKLALAEKRHHMLYLDMACKFMSRSNVLDILKEVAVQEQDWIDNNNLTFRMHSGVSS